MRFRALLLALVVAASAGCFGGDDGEPPVATTPESPVTTPETTPPETTPETTPSPPVEPTPPPPPEPKVVYEKVFDFTQGDATGQSPKVETSQAVPEGYGNVTVEITLERTSGAPTPLPVSGTVNSPMVRVLDPAGTEQVAEGREGASVEAMFPTTPGAWTIRYEGAGTLRATVTLTAVP